MKTNTNSKWVDIGPGALFWKDDISTKSRLKVDRIHHLETEKDTSQHAIAMTAGYTLTSQKSCSSHA